MSGTWFTADTHFGHRLVAGLRGFDDPADHDEAIVARWNAVVRPGDLVWHLGDAGPGNEDRTLGLAGRLNGRKHLIAGNHDACWPGHRDARAHQRRWLEVFESVQAFARIQAGGRRILLSHFPYAGGGDHSPGERYTQYRLRDEGLWLIHGHTHQPDRVDGMRSLHAGLDAWGLAPVGQGAVLSRMQAHEDGLGKMLVLA